MVLALPFAALLAAGPFVAWDLSAQPPKAAAPKAWPQPSPWKAAGKGALTAVKGIARVYLPRSEAAAPLASAVVSAAPAMASSLSVAAGSPPAARPVPPLPGPPAVHLYAE